MKISYVLTLLLALSGCALSGPVFAAECKLEDTKAAYIEFIVDVMKAEKSQIKSFTDPVVITNTVTILEKELGPPPFKSTDVTEILYVKINNQYGIIFLNNECAIADTVVQDTFFETKILSIVSISI